MIKQGSRVKLEYIGKLEDGTVFDKSQKEKPLDFVVGAGTVIRGFEDGVKGMNIGDEKSITIEPDLGYGLRDESLVMKFEKSVVPDNIKLERGMPLKLNLSNGNMVEATVVDVGEDNIIVDLNHPLAGKTIIFDLKILSIE
ncbi:peptidylprolyl isomerase [Elusimicrobiota bacterium]